MASNVPTAFSNFDALPDAALVPDKIVAAVFGCSVPTVWRMARDGKIPAPVRTGTRMTRWQVGGLRKALAASA